MCSMHQQNSSASTRDKDTQKKEKQRKQSKEEKECEWQKDDNIEKLWFDIRDWSWGVTLKMESFQTKLL